MLNDRKTGGQAYQGEGNEILSITLQPVCLPTRLSPLKLHCTMWSHTYRMQWNTEIAHRVFLDNEGAFDSTSFGVIIKAAEQHGLGCTIFWLVSSMLGSRKITVTLAGHTLEGSVTNSCWQRCILWPLLCSLVVDELIRGLNENGCYKLRYTDDIAILISEKFPNTISELFLKALGMVQQWCDRTQLSINPQKMVIVPFIRKRDLRGLKGANPLWTNIAADY
jgi:hypothetical protein